MTTTACDHLWCIVTAHGAGKRKAADRIWMCANCEAYGRAGDPTDPKNPAWHDPLWLRLVSGCYAVNPHELAPVLH